MSLERFRALQAAGDAEANVYLASNFEALFAEAVGEFSMFGALAIGGAVLAVCLAVAVWWFCRRQLPWPWAWWLPLLALAAYAAIKSSVVFQIIDRASELQAMWQLYFKSATPLKMVRTPVLGLLALSTLMGMTVLLPRRGRRRRDAGQVDDGRRV